jgi:hypothetical protein
MSGFSDLVKLQCLVASSCPQYDAGFALAPLAVALDFYPFFLTIGIYAISLYRYELYLALVSLFLTIDWLINWLLQDVVFKQAGRWADCGYKHQMPSFAAESIMVFQTLMVLYLMTWGRRNMYQMTTLLMSFSTVVLVARIYIGINTRAQLLAGALVGIVSGALYHVLLRYLIYPYFENILSFALIKWLGFIDTLCSKQSKHLYNK